MRTMATVLESPRLYRLAGRVGWGTLRFAPVLAENSLNPWYQQREMPEPPAQSFRDWYINQPKP